MTAELRQLEDMREAAFGLGMDFAQAAKAESDPDRRVRLFEAFDRSFTSVRLSITLAMRLRREAHVPAPAAAERPEREVEAPEPPDHAERTERYDERDRDRETASLPILLSTLERVADDAEALLPQAAELPGLRELLDRVAARPAPKPTPAPSGALRARLSGGTATLTLAPTRPKPGLPGLTGGPPRRSTGPPRR